MKNLILMLIFLGLTTTAQALSIQLNIESIECSDPIEDAEVKMYFSTTHTGARKYERRLNSIPYAYGNLRAFTFKSGQMSLINNPQSENGVIYLFEDDGFDVSSLELHPTSKSNIYEGLLSGSYEDSYNDWVPLKDHKLICTLEFR